MLFLSVTAVYTLTYGPLGQYQITNGD